AVVSDGQREDEHCEPLHADERGEHVRGSDCGGDGPPPPQARKRGVEARRRRGGLRGHACAPATAPTCSRNQATVRSRPSRRGVRASKPNSSCARVASRLRRGWPLGIFVSHTILPRKLTTSATRSASSRIEISLPAPRFTGSGASYFSVASTIPSTQSST